MFGQSPDRSGHVDLGNDPSHIAVFRATNYYKAISRASINKEQKQQLSFFYRSVPLLYPSILASSL